MDRACGASGGGGAGQRGRPAAAARHGRGPELAGTAFRRTGERAGGTGGVGETRRTRCLAHLDERDCGAMGSTTRPTAAAV